MTREREFDPRELAMALSRHTIVCRFPLGQLAITSHAQSRLPADAWLDGLRRHAAGDWGEVDENDRQINEEALREDMRLLSAYTTPDGTRFWIITEADRSVTTILLPEDY